MRSCGSVNVSPAPAPNGTSTPQIRSRGGFITSSRTDSLEPDSALFGLEHLTGVAGKPVVIFANHLSYSDANLLEVLLHRAGGAALVDRLTVVAGPKVYSSLKRRFSSLCFGTIKTPQSSGLSTEDAVMNVRDVARAARRSIDIAHERLRRGDALLVFAEATRSRTSGLQQMLTGVARYLECPGTCVVPVGITGTEALFPIGDDMIHPVKAVARIGRPIEASALRERTGRDRRLMTLWRGSPPRPSPLRKPSRRHQDGGRRRRRPSRRSWIASGSLSFVVDREMKSIGIVH